MKKRWLIGVAVCGLALAACGDDDGGSVRNVDGDECPSQSASGAASGSTSETTTSSASGAGSASASGACPSASASASGSESGSGSGLSSSELAESNDELITEAVAQYQTYVAEQVDEMVAATTTFTDAVRAGDIEAAKAAYAPSRVAWERIEPIAGLDPRHRRRGRRACRRLRGSRRPARGPAGTASSTCCGSRTRPRARAEFADKLDADLASLQEQLATLELPAGALAVGAAELIEEVSEGKITGEEDRYSHTDLWDFAANIDGSKELIVLLTPALEETDPELLAGINEGFGEIESQLAAYEDGNGGYASYEELTDDDKAEMQATLAAALGGRVSGRRNARPGVAVKKSRPEPRPDVQPDPGRRRFLRSAASGAAALAVGGPALLAGCSDDAASTGSGAADEPAEGKEAEAPAERTKVEFYGPHQNGVLLRAPESGIVLAFDSQANTREELRDTLVELSDEAQKLMDGEPPEQRPAGFPPTDSGVFGDELPPSELSVIVGVGASLFDERYGLADRKPRELAKMPFLANDRLDPAISHGDVSLTISASTADMTNYALRQLMRRTRGVFTLRWMLEGFNTIQGDFGAGFAPGRNLLGFKDGTANPDATDEQRMDDLVWVGAEHNEPAWASGGAYQAIRIIRMFVEFWDRTRLSEQEALIGRHKMSGAPLGGEEENEAFDYADDPDGERIPFDAHIRRANPRTPETDSSVILRRGFSYFARLRRCGPPRPGLALRARSSRAWSAVFSPCRNGWPARVSRSTSSRSAADSSTSCPAPSGPATTSETASSPAPDWCGTDKLCPLGSKPASERLRVNLHSAGPSANMG